MADSNKYIAKKKFEINIQGVTIRRLQDCDDWSSERFSIYLGGMKSEWRLHLEDYNSATSTRALGKTIKLKKRYLDPGMADFTVKYKIRGFNNNQTNIQQKSHLYSSTALKNGKFDIPLAYFSQLPITIHLEIQWEQKKNQSRIVEPVMQIRNMNNFFNSKSFSDLTLMSSDAQEIPAHRLILTANSSIFDLKLNTAMNANEQSNITLVINDIDGATLREMLRFIYCGKVENIDHHARALLQAAEKSEIAELKQLCASSIMKTISETNIFDTIVLADQCDAQNLLQKCFEFINNNYDRLRENKEWKKLDLELMLKIMDAIEKDKTTEINVSL